VSQLLGWLSGGDLRSDGMANEVVKVVLENPGLFDELFAGLSEPDDVIRGRAADALEKVCRSRPDLFVDRLSELFQTVRWEQVVMARFHIAMILGHLALHGDLVDDIAEVLLSLLEDESAFVRSWAIVGLCIVGRRSPAMAGEIVTRISSLERDASAAVRSRARRAITLLIDENAPFPKGWIKSQHLTELDI
jgi:HEAT repeat protein